MYLCICESAYLRIYSLADCLLSIYSLISSHLISSPSPPPPSPVGRSFLRLIFQTQRSSMRLLSWYRERGHPGTHGPIIPLPSLGYLTLKTDLHMGGSRWPIIGRSPAKFTLLPIVGPARLPYPSLRRRFCSVPFLFLLFLPSFPPSSESTSLSPTVPFVTFSPSPPKGTNTAPSTQLTVLLLSASLD